MKQDETRDDEQEADAGEDMNMNYSMIGDKE